MESNENAIAENASPADVPPLPAPWRPSGDPRAATGGCFVPVLGGCGCVVLFVVGIGTTFELRQVRWALAALGAVLLLGAIVIFTQQPLP